MEILFIKIIAISAALAWAHTDQLTANYGLLDWLPQYYPKALDKLLNCAFCLSGWLSLAGVLIFYKDFGNYIILVVTLAPFCGMAAAKILFYR